LFTAPVGGREIACVAVGDAIAEISVFGAVPVFLTAVVYGCSRASPVKALVVGSAGVFVIASLAVLQPAAIGDYAIAVKTAAIAFIQVWAITAHTVTAVAAINRAVQPVLTPFTDTVSAGRPTVLRTGVRSTVAWLTDGIPTFLKLAVGGAIDGIFALLAESISAVRSAVIAVPCVFAAGITHAHTVAAGSTAVFFAASWVLAWRTEHIPADFTVVGAS
tara:strand:- start:218 stop:874 length:657 start_codon:yes stop_codon:yes gene_type:complete